MKAGIQANQEHSPKIGTQGSNQAEEEYKKVVFFALLFIQILMATFMLAIGYDSKKYRLLFDPARLSLLNVYPVMSVGA